MRSAIRSSVLGSSPGVLAAVSLLVSCSEPLVEDVPTSVCASGKRWVGEFTANEEMYPGQDCVGCHVAVDGPPLLAAGTVYGVLDSTLARTSAGLCFGVEGALVTITAGDGEVLQTRTNRAGNFYFEGRPESLVMPYGVEVEYVLPDGRVTRQPMKTQPSYGGCGRCHGAAPGMPGPDAGGTPGAADVIAEAPIFTGPVAE